MHRVDQTYPYVSLGNPRRWKAVLECHSTVPGIAGKFSATPERARSHTLGRMIHAHSVFTKAYLPLCNRGTVSSKVPAR